MNQKVCIVMSHGALESQINSLYWIKDEADTMYYATPDGAELDEELVESVMSKTEESMDYFEDIINSELEPDSKKSIGNKRLWLILVKDF